MPKLQQSMFVSRRLVETIKLRVELSICKDYVTPNLVGLVVQIHFMESYIKVPISMLEAEPLI